MIARPDPEDGTQTKSGDPALQLKLDVSYVLPPAGTNHVMASVVPPVWYSLVIDTNSTVTGLGLIDPAGSDNLTITGHSLGGHLAAVGKRLFPNLFDNAVTFNAPGFDPSAGLTSLPGITPAITGGVYFGVGPSQLPVM